jgi:ABC-type nitrate/sulfonate/bicarbonate transport system substrate-binding protein
MAKRFGARGSQAGRVLAGVVVIFLLAFGVAACGQSDDETTAPGAQNLDRIAAAGAGIPRESLRWGMAPFPDESLPIVGIHKGYFDDVGLSVDEAKIDCTASLAPLLTGNVEVCSAALEALLPQLDNTQAVQSFVSMDTVVGLGIFIPPESNAKSVQDFMDEGDSFDVAIRKAMAQLKGQRVALATDPAARLLYNIAFSLGDISPDEFQRSDLENPNIVTLALAGKTDFPAPSGGAEVVRLLQEGFRPLVTQEQIQEFSNDPRRFETAIHGSFITTDQFYDQDYATILRAASVIYRILGEARTDFPAVSEELLPFINAYAGQELSRQELKDELTNFAKLRTFEEVGEFYAGKNSPVDLNATLQANIDALREANVLQQQHRPDEIEGAEQVWEDLNTLKGQADDLFDQVDASGSDAALVDAARQQYDNLNFLDAVRFLRAAQES